MSDNPFLTTTSSPVATPPGWYLDPAGSGRQRYWNGTAWEPVSSGSSWLTSWPAIVAGFLLCFIPGLILLWRRPQTSTRTKAIVTAASTAVLLLFGALGRSGPTPSTTPDPTPPAVAQPTPQATASQQPIPVTPIPETTPNVTPSTPPSPTPVVTSSPAATTQAAAGASAALMAALDSLAVKGRAPKTGYSREEFGAAWADVDQNGCNTRDDVLADTLIDPVVASDCNVTDGTLRDPYTDVTIGLNDPAGVDVDHMVALSDAWQKGAQSWTPAKRVAFANDPLNLQPTLSGVNRSKGDSDVASWLPPNASYRCAFVARIIAVKQKYGLWVTSGEKAAMVRVLSRCNGLVLPGPGTAPTEAPDAVVSAAVPLPVVSVPTPAPDGGGLDPQFRTCKAAKSAGFGPYRSGIDPEYEWYRDADSDGIVCE